ncbi:MAG: FAD-dependent oxidoreductase, partial [Cyanobacteria bacterium J06642_9]
FDRDPALYFNLGPARIPYHHTALLGYCKEFGVPLEVIVNENRAAYFQDDGAFGGSAVQNRQVINDSRGYLAELLAKAINRNALEQEVSVDEQEKLLAFVSRFGNLNDDYAYAGSSRSGYRVTPGAATAAGDLAEPLAFSSLLDSAFWRYKMHFGEGYHQAATMLQPVGGMDQIAKAFAQQVGHLITYNAVVSQIRKTPAGVRVVYTDAASGEETAVTADFAICTFPLSVLSDIEADFSPAFQDAIASAADLYANAIKVAFQARRFWEEDQNIYGGISWTEADITQLWYPSGGFHKPQGIIVGAYIWDNPIAEQWEPMTTAERLARAIADGSKIHPNYAQEISAPQGCSIAWGKVPYSQGGWIEWDEETRTTAYRVLTQPDDTIYLAGEHLSYLTGWQEGAILSAHEAVRGIANRMQAISA